MAAPTPEELLLDYLDRRERGESIDFESICAAHPEHAVDLRSLFHIWQLAQGAVTDASRDPSVSLADRIRARFGAGIDPAVSLAADPEPAAPQLVEGLKSRAPSSSRYEVQGEVGKGGMGAVLRVFDRDLRRFLAMKVMIDPTRDRAVRLSRFLEEAQVTSQLDHPGIVPVHELGIDGNGRVFFTMKLVKGITLDDVFAAVRSHVDGWTVTRALSVVQRVCEAMAFAHEKGVVHRDLKPLNVMVGRFGETYVMDWGIARVLGRPDSKDVRIRKDDETPSAISTHRGEQRKDASESSLMTMDGEQIGTPAYMSPEQARGDLEQIGPASDVYAVGAMLYHLLSGRTPYVEPGEHPGGKVILGRVLEGPPEPLHRIARDAPAELVAICEKAMARPIEARYGSMLALAHDLRAFLEGRVVTAYETGAFAEMKKWVRRNRGLAAAAGVAILALAGIGVVQSLRKADVEARKSEFDQLAGKVYLERAIAAQEPLWPAWPSEVPALERWLAEDWSRLDRLRPTLARTIAGLEARGALAAGSSDPESESQRFLHETLTQLSSDIDRLEKNEKASVEKRIAWAKRIDALTLHHPHARVTWDEARAAIARADGMVASTRYRDPPIDLLPQTGLVPIGMNPATKLWEFYELRSACDLEAGDDPAAIEIPTHTADGSIPVTDATGIVFVLVPGGTFLQGAQASDPARPNFDPAAKSDEAPQSVTLAPFFIARHEVTKGQWKRLTSGDQPSYYQLGPPYDDDPAPIGWTHPVERVTWTSADLWMRSTGLELPTEAQWEYAVRAGTTTRWWSGDEAASLAGNANVLDRRAEARFPGWGRQEGDFDDGFSTIAPAGTFRMNPFGLHDVAGNVQEWCRDAYVTPYGAAREGDGLRTAGPDNAANHIARGGSFNDPASIARSASRNFLGASTAIPTLGLRVARAIDPDVE